MNKSLLAWFSQRRGAAAHPEVRRMLEELPEAQAQQLHRFLVGAMDDARDEGKREAERRIGRGYSPWR